MDQNHISLMRFLCFLTALVFFDLSTRSQILEWNHLLEPRSVNSFSSLEKTAIHSDFSMTIGGYFYGTVDFDPDSLADHLMTASPSGARDAFFSKYDKNGIFKWSRHLIAKDLIRINGLVRDGAENIYVTGSFNDSVDLNPGTSQAIYVPVNGGAEDQFLVKYNAKGSFQWARQVVSSSFTRPADMVVDQNGNLIIGGNYKGSTDFDPGIGVSSHSSNGEDVFLAIYSSSGAYLNSISFGGINAQSSVQKLSHIEVDGSNNIYVSGLFQGSVDFDPGSSSNVLISRGQNDFFLAKFNNLLQLQWVYQLGSAIEEGSISHSVTDQEIWVAGSFKDSVDADLKSGTSLLISQGSFDIFLASYTFSGSLNHAVSIGGSGMDEVMAVRAQNGDSVFISGHFEGSVDFDPGTPVKMLSASSYSSVFFANYSGSLSLNYASVISGSDDVFNTGLQLNEAGYPYLLGQFDGTADFNKASAFSKNFSGPATYIAKYRKCGHVNFQISSQNANCNQKNGSAQAQVTGGNPTLKYYWTSGHLSPQADSLRSGTYFLTVVDTLGCIYESDPVLISDKDGPVVNVQAKLDVSCNGGNDGAIALNVTGGLPPYSFAWSNSSKQQNINQLKAGFYEIQVTDKNSCRRSIRIEIEEPDAIQVIPIRSEPNCNQNNGALTAVPVGGTSPYTYSWNPGGSSSSTLFNIAAGVYRVTVTDAHNCHETKAIAVSDQEGPDLVLDSLINSGCGSGGGGIFVSVYGGNPAYSYLWTPGNAISQDITGLQPTSYDLVVTDNSSCKACFTAEIDAEKPTAPEICIVDVDSSNGHAQVLWEKNGGKGNTDHFSVYRETTTKNKYDLIADSIDYSSLSLYEDVYADTWVRPWSYRISLTDTCGIESEPSKVHTTIHTVVTQNAQKNFNILWSNYWGNFPVYDYTCFRYSDSTGTLDSVTTLPAGIHTFTDNNSPSSGGDVYYVMQIRHPSGCTATEARNKNSSRSNRGSLNRPDYNDSSNSVSVFSNNAGTLSVYPNPASEYVNLSLYSGGITTAEMMLQDISGHVVQLNRLNLCMGINRIRVDLSYRLSGFYLILLKVDGKFLVAKLLIENSK